MNTQEINQEISKLQNQLKELEHDRRKTFERITGVEANKFRVIDENFISITCDNLKEMKKVVTNLQPFKNGWKIGSNKPIYITSLYKVSIRNNCYNRELQLEFENNSGVNHWVAINFNNLPDWFKDAYFVSDMRKLYDTETHYVNIPSHYKKFKDIRIPCYTFGGYPAVSFYGGDKVLTSEALIQEIVEEIKNV